MSEPLYSYDLAHVGSIHVGHRESGISWHYDEGEWQLSYIEDEDDDEVLATLPAYHMDEYTDDEGNEYEVVDEDEGNARRIIKEPAGVALADEITHVDQLSRPGWYIEDEDGDEVEIGDDKAMEAHLMAVAKEHPVCDVAVISADYYDIDCGGDYHSHPEPQYDDEGEEIEQDTTDYECPHCNEHLETLTAMVQERWPGCSVEVIEDSALDSRRHANGGLKYRPIPDSWYEAAW